MPILTLSSPQQQQQKTPQTEKVIEREEKTSSSAVKNLQKADTSSVVIHAEIITTSTVLNF